MNFQDQLLAVGTHGANLILDSGDLRPASSSFEVNSQLRSDLVSALAIVLEQSIARLLVKLNATLVHQIAVEEVLKERVRKATALVGAGIESQEQAVAALAISDDPWLNACAAYAIGVLGLKSMPGIGFSGVTEHMRVPMPPVTVNARM